MVGGEFRHLVQKFGPFCLQVKLVGKFFFISFFENNFFFKRFWKILRNRNYYTCLYDSRPRIIFFGDTLEKFYCRPKIWTKIWTNILRWISVRNSNGRNFGEIATGNNSFFDFKDNKNLFFVQRLYNISLNSRVLVFSKTFSTFFF